jgi:hypothetical protein
MASNSSRLRSQVAALMAAYAAPESLVERDGMALWLERDGARSWRVIVAPRDAVVFERFAGQRAEGQEGYAIQRCPTSPANARALRETLPWLRPALLGLSTSAGFGDRLGRATVGHVRALAGRPSRCSPTRPGGLSMLAGLDQSGPTPTTLVEHIYIASELRRLGVRWVSLAPRYIGRFEKGVEYIGDLSALARDLRGRAEEARAWSL